MFSRDTPAATIMDHPLSDFPGWHFMVHCGGCRNATQIFTDHLAARHGNELTVADILVRLRSRRCRGLPSRTVLASGMPGMGKAEPVILQPRSPVNGLTTYSGAGANTTCR